MRLAAKKWRALSFSLGEEKAEEKRTMGRSNGVVLFLPSVQCAVLSTLLRIEATLLPWLSLFYHSKKRSVLPTSTVSPERPLSHGFWTRTLLLDTPRVLCDEDVNSLRASAWSAKGHSANPKRIRSGVYVEHFCSR